MHNKLLKFATSLSVWVLTLAIAIGVFSLTGTLVQAWNGTLATAFASGSGTQSSPYVIRTEGQLGYFAKQMNDGVTYEGLYIKLGANLNTTGNTWAYDNETLTPEFKGSFDGQCYTITTDCPIFPKIGSTGTVQKLNAVAGSAFDGDSVLTWHNAGTIQACTARGTIPATGSGGYAVGLICSDNTGTVQYCGAVGAATAYGDDCDAYAGMVGENRGVVDRCFAAVSCSAYGSGKYNSGYTCPLGNGQWGSQPHTVTNSYYDRTLSPGAYSKGVSLTTTEMKSAAFLLEFSGNTVSGARWVKGSDGYPTLEAASTSTVTINGWDGAKTQVFGSTKSISLVRSGSGTIYYTTDGTDPQSSSTRKSSTASSVTLSITKDTVVSAIVYYNSKYSVPIRVQYVYMPGSGTEADPYRISSKYALEAIRLNTSACYKLTTNLTYSASDFEFGGVAAGGWTPFPSFTGKLDGAGYAIYNLKGRNGGLIHSNSGTVTSLRMVNHDLFRGGTTGPIANTNNGTITKCYAKSAWTLNSLPSAIDLEYTSKAGGIAGQNSGTITHCSTEGIVVGRQVTDDGDHYIGGIFGSGGEAHSCMSRALIVTQGAENFIYAGGISGSGDSYDCWTDIEFYVDSRINYDAFFGGLSGYHYACWANRCVVDSYIVKQSPNAYIRETKYTWSSSSSQDNYRLSKTAQPEAFPALDFENTWMIAENGVVPRAVMDANGHCYDMQSYSAPNCTSQGISVLKCTICGNVKQCIVSDPVHQTVLDKGTPATCTATGISDGIHCSLCNKVLTPQTTLSALGHSFTNYVSNANETCTVDGTETAKCDRCDVTDTRVETGSARHLFTTYHNNNDATCTADGTETSQCDRCTATDTRTIVGSKLPHTFKNYISNNDATYLADGTETAKCDGCDATDTRTAVGSRIKPIQIKVLTLPDKTSYKTGEKVDLTGLTFLATYSNKETMTFPAEEAQVSVDTSTSGKKTAIISFLGLSARFEILVHDSGKILVDSSLYPKHTYYGKNVDVTKTFTFPGANSLTFTFYSGTKTESGYDYIYVYDGAGNQLGKYTGTEAAYKSFNITGDTFKVRLTSDSSENAYGYSFSSIYADVGDTYHPAETDPCTATCTQSGLSEGTHCRICGIVLTQQVSIGALGHSFTQYVYDNNATGLQDGTKTAKCDRCDVTDTVTAPGTILTPTSIEVATPPTNRSFGLGDTVTLSDLSGLVLRGYYANGTQELLPASFVESVTGVTSTIGTRTATVTYKNRTAQFDIFVHNRMVVTVDSTQYPESAHTYQANTDQTKTFTYSGATKLVVTFSANTEVETNYDYIYLYNGSGAQIAKYTGTAAAGVTVTIPGNSFKVRLTSDSIIHKYGYAFSSIVVYGDLEHTAVTDPAVNATCTQTGLTAGSHCSICNKVIVRQNATASLGHNFSKYVSDNNATCLEDGTKTAKCSRCVATNTLTDTGTKLGHSFTSYVSDKNATCQEDGTKTAKCDRCDITDTKPDPDSKLGHSFTNYVSNGDATYTENGTETAKCDNCDATDTRVEGSSKIAPAKISITTLPNKVGYTVGQTIDLTGLTFLATYQDGKTISFTAADVESVTADLSCAGKKAATILYSGCSATFDIFVHNGGDVLIDASSYPQSKHNYDNNTDETKVFTWENAQSLTITFTDNTALEDEYDKLYLYDGQDNQLAVYTGIEATGETITIPGNTFKIRLVSDSMVNNYGYAFSAIVAHTEIEHPPVVDPATVTCTQDGLTEGSHCGICDMVLVAQNAAPALGHSFTNYTSDHNATCQADGTKTAKCDRCDIIDTKADPGSKLDHCFTDYVSDGNATCLEDGTKTAQCDHCEATDTKADPDSKLGHGFTNYISDGNATCLADGTKTAKCDRCQATDTKADPDSKLGHSFTNYTSDKNATCQADGTKTAKCDRCDVTDTLADKGSKLEHKFGAVSVVPPTVDSQGYSIKVCADCGKEDKFDFVDPLPRPSGDIDGNAEVDADDAITLLLHISMPDVYPLDAPADLNGDGQFNTDDVIDLLLHICLPDLFPLPTGKEVS